ncbi:MAG: hypothetical protein C0501_09380 [Isosphaera sp.]|nr:hypothetical protein [Isosphaera sp.]
MTAATPEDDPADRTESHDSILVEFTDADLELVPPDPALVAAAVRRAAPHPEARPDPRAAVDLAECLLEQAVLFKGLKRFADAAPKAAEAAGLFERAGLFGRVADCFRVSAEVLRGLGDAEAAAEFLRKEEDIRRRLAA